MPVLLSVNVGMPRNVPWHGKTVYTGVWKHPVDGPAMVRRPNIDGDGQGDTNGHGGEQRAVLVYQIQSYRHWQDHFGRDDFSYGQFGENLTVDGLSDDEVCIGDRYRIGEAEFEVTQPRVTCYRVGLRLGEPDLPALLVSHHRPGFYLRVITEGHIQAGDQIVKTRTGPHALTVADTDALLYLPHRDRAKLGLAVQIPALSPGWQDSFHDLLAAAEGDGTTAPLPGVEPAPRPGPAWTGFRALRVDRVARENTTVSSIYLAAADRSRLPPARAGQYLTLRVTGAGHPAPVRSYSLSSAPDAGSYRISVKHEPHGAASSYLNRDCNPERSWTWPRPAATSSSTTAPARSCSSPPASVSHQSCPCCTNSRPVEAPATSGGCTGRADHGNIPSPPKCTPYSHPSRTATSTCSTAQPHPPKVTAATPQPGACPKTSWPRLAFPPARAPTSAARPRS